MNSHERSIDVLPTEVFGRILDFLHPNDLVEVSKLSNHSRNSVADYFRLNRQCGWATISDGSSPNFDFDQKEKYEKYFRSIIRNVKIDMRSFDPIMDKFRFVKENCSKSIRWFVLHAGYSSVQINESHIEIIGDQIKHLYAFAFDSSIKFNLQWNRFSELRVLIDYLNGNQKPWMTEMFPNLHTLCMVETKSDLDQVGLTNFIRNHNQIRTFCSNNFSAIECILSSNINLSNAVFCHIGQDDIENMLNLIDQYYSNIRSFEFDIRWVDQDVFSSVLRRIARMQKVTKLHCSLKKPNFLLLNDDNIQLPHIRELDMMFIHIGSSFTRDELKLLVKTFPNVVDLWMTLLYTEPAMSPNEFVSIIVDGLQKLKDLHVNCSFNFREQNYELRNWDSVRQSVRNAPIVTVHEEGGGRI